MASYTVGSAKEILSALQKAGSGDTIYLKAGTYSSISLQNIKIPGNVTITSLDQNNPAVINSLLVANSSGLTFSHVDMKMTATSAQYAFTVRSSSNITFDDVRVEGVDGDAAYQQSPFMVRNSSNVTITDSEFSHAWHGVNLLDNNGVTLDGNYFHDIRTDGIRGGGNSNIAISSNLFTDFNPWAGDHPDAIQFWTTGTKASASNITITDNVVLRGDGDAMQGIFMRDELGNLPFKNVNISGNVVMGGMYNGIAVDNVVGGTVTDNIVAGLGNDKSWIGVSNATNVSVTANAATAYQLDGSATASGNVAVAPIYDGGLAMVTLYSAQLKAKLAGGIGAKVDLIDLVDGAYQAKLAIQPAVTVVTGTSGADRLTVTNVGDTRLEGGAGNDILTGGQFNNELVGGAGNDTYHVRGAGDVVVEDVDGGTDTIYAYVDHKMELNIETMQMMSGGLVGQGNEQANRLIGSSGDDTLHGGDGADTMQGNDGDDQLHGDGGDDILYGHAGRDMLSGGDGNDKLYGGDGDDRIDGGEGSDTIEGGAGADILTGGAGRDFFIFRDGDFPANGGFDRITDFQTGTDIISLSLMDANVNTVANDTFKFIGLSNFTGAAGQLRYEVVNGDSYVSGDLDGDGKADFALHLDGVATLKAADFYL